jgi:two-component system, NarL family, sensor kinase
LTDTEYFIVIGSLITFVFISFLVSFLIFNQKKHFEYKTESENMKRNYDQALLQSQLEIQEQTLKTISQEIHDNVGQVLTLAKLNLSTTTIVDDETSGKIKDTQRLIAKAIQDLRDLSRSLNTDYVEEMGLVRSIEYELEMLGKTDTIQPLFLLEGHVVRLDKQKELILFRIVQEVIHNTVKHAEAKTIKAEIQFSINSLEIRITDDGKGFIPGTQSRNTNHSLGLGLRNIRNRANLIGAQCSINSQLASGTEVLIVFPLNAETE